MTELPFGYVTLIYKDEVITVKNFDSNTRLHQIKNNWKKLYGPKFADAKIEVEYNYANKKTLK